MKFGTLIVITNTTGHPGSPENGEITVELARFYDRRSNGIANLTIIFLCPGKSYSKFYGAESRFTNIRFNDIPGLTMEI